MQQTFMEVGQLVPEILKKWLEADFWSCNQHHVNTCSFPCTKKAYILYLVENGSVVSDKSKF